MSPACPPACLRSKGLGRQAAGSRCCVGWLCTHQSGQADRPCPASRPGSAKAAAAGLGRTAACRLCTAALTSGRPSRSTTHPHRPSFFTQGPRQGGHRVPRRAGGGGGAAGREPAPAPAGHRGGGRVGGWVPPLLPPAGCQVELRGRSSMQAAATGGRGGRLGAWVLVSTRRLCALAGPHSSFAHHRRPAPPCPAGFVVSSRFSPVPSVTQFEAQVGRGPGRARAGRAAGWLPAGCRQGGCMAVQPSPQLLKR